MEVRTEDSLESRENSGAMKENPMQHNSMFLWMFAFFSFLKASFTDNKRASSLYRPTSHTHTHTHCHSHRLIFTVDDG